MEEITIRGTKTQRNLMEWSQRVADCRSMVFILQVAAVSVEIEVVFQLGSDF